MAKKTIKEKPLTLKEIAHYFYHVGSLDGITRSLKKGNVPTPKIEFEKRFKEFKNNK